MLTKHILIASKVLTLGAIAMACPTNGFAQSESPDPASDASPYNSPATNASVDSLKIPVPATTNEEVPTILNSFAPVAGGWTAESVAAKAVTVAPSVDKEHASALYAESIARHTKGAFYPRVDLTMRYTRLGKVATPPLDFGGMSFPNPFPQILNHYATGVTATVPVSDLFLSILPSYRGAQAFANAARYKELVEKETVALRAREAYYRHAQTRAAKQVAQDGVRLLEAYVVDLESLVGAGVASKPDLSDARAQLAQAKVGLAQVQAGVQVTGVILRRMLNLPSDAELVLGEGLADSGSVRVPSSSNELLRQAMAQRPEVKALRAVVRGQKKLVKSKQAGGLPHLLLQGNVNYNNPNTRVIPLQDEFSTAWDINLLVTWSPNDYTTSKRESERAEFDVAKTEADLRALEDGLAIAAVSALSEYTTALQAISAAKEGVAAAEAGYRARRDLLAAGSASSTEVLNAETRLRRSQLELIDTHVNLRIAQAKLIHVVGEAAP
ncbi:MAG: TolC family protein [Kofleriaceae bacterium]|nr:TolC family protein [Kofleriaceae bacterium]